MSFIALIQNWENGCRERFMDEGHKMMSRIKGPKKI